MALETGFSEPKRREGKSNKMKRIQVKDLLFALVILFLVGVIVGLKMAPSGRTDSVPPLAKAEAAANLTELSDSFAAIAQAVTPAVVNVNSTRIIRGGSLFDDPFFRDFFGEDFGGLFGRPERREQSLGSAVIVSPDGTILTNHHVIEGADAITVSLADKRTFPAQVKGTDPMSDVAVLKVNATGLPTVQWGDSDKLRVGDWVVAIGNPYGLSQTVTAGIVSAKGRIDVGVSAYEDFIQTDAAINPGNSGGALVDISQRLVGINTAIFSESGGYQGIGFAIPSNMARRVMKDLLEHGQVIRGWIGIIVQPLTSRWAQELGIPGMTGVIVDKLYRDQPAHRAGLEAGDALLMFNNEKIQSPGHLRNLVADAPIGQKAEFKVWRQGKLKTVSVAIVEQPVNPRTGRPYPGI